MRYAVFSDIHANLEALETVLAKIDEIAKDEPIDHIWFLGDLVGYGPNPNECIARLRERTDVIIAGNHDWAAVGKIDLEDFSAAARISAEWTAQQLTEENRTFLTNLPERIEIDDCTLVHGSPYGPLWEYLTSEVLAERSFQYFSSRYCFLGHTHVPVIFQQHDPIANAPTTPLAPDDRGEDESTTSTKEHVHPNEEHFDPDEEDDETTEVAAVRLALQTAKAATQGDRARVETTEAIEAEPLEHAETVLDLAEQPEAEDTEEDTIDEPEPQQEQENNHVVNTASTTDTDDDVTVIEVQATVRGETGGKNEHEPAGEVSPNGTSEGQAHTPSDQLPTKTAHDVTPEDTIANAEDRLNSEIEELLTLLGLSQSMVKVTNEMLVPPEGDWQTPEDYRAIINPGGVGQPRDGDPRAAFMIYDTERGFTFYRVAYAFDKTQEKIIKAGLPHYLAVRLAYGR